MSTFIKPTFRTKIQILRLKMVCFLIGLLGQFGNLLEERTNEGDQFCSKQVDVMVFGHVHEAVVVQHVDGRHRRRSRYRRGARAVGRPGGASNKCGWHKQPKWLR